MLLLDLTHTSHTQSQTGIQRVTRALHRTLAPSGDVRSVCYDPFLRAWRSLQSWEVANLDEPRDVAKGRGAKWPWHVRLTGRVCRMLGATGTTPIGDALIVPEVFSPATARAFPTLFSSVRGPRVALFHDDIALKYPELSPSKTVARFPAYLQELLAFDGIAAISKDSAESLQAYWQWLGVKQTPRVLALPLAVEISSSRTTSIAAPDTEPTVLFIGSVEGRKNHLALLEACESLWTKNKRFTLHLIGLSHPQTGRAALEKIKSLQAAGRPVRYDGPATETAVTEAYARCRFTVYPSLIEGFGLPVQESLAHGKPCICSGQGALGESAVGGGCVTIDKVDAPSLAQAIERLLDRPDDVARLSAEAKLRPFKMWRTYTQELLDWMQTLQKRS